MKNFHLPLPEDTYAELRAEAERANVSATAVAREAISTWLLARRRLSRQQAIRDYAAAAAGTNLDLDPRLESAAIAELLAFDRETR